MKAILFAAGKGSRISRHIDGKPKCSLELEPGRALIRYSIDMLQRRGITDIIMVLGYRHEVLMELLQGTGVRFVINPFFDVTNSIASLWFARDLLQGDERFILMNADVFLSEPALDLILAEQKSPVLFYDVTRRAEADYKFFCRDGQVVKYGKKLSLEETSGEYIGCASLDPSFMLTFAAQLDRLIMAQHHDMWWEDVLYTLTTERPVYAVDVHGAFWGEVDFIEDYERISKFYRENCCRS